MGNGIAELHSVIHSPALGEAESLGAPLQACQPIRLASIVSALSQALDLSTGQPVGHSVRSCAIGMRIAEEMGVPAEVREDLFYALLLKDCGCSANASKTFHALASDDLKAKRDVKTTDWTKLSWETVQYALSHVAPGKPFLERSRALFRLALGQKTHAKDATKVRCERGSALAKFMGLSDVTAMAILNLDEHWDGSGYPDGLRGREISLLSRIMLLAQTFEVFLVSSGATAAAAVINERSGTWFDPEAVKAMNSVLHRCGLWSDLLNDQLPAICLRTEPAPRMMKPDEAGFDNICMAFANIVDAKSPFTFDHSSGVANATVAIARMMGLPRGDVMMLRNAALLHDIGKLGVSNTILEKPAKLDNEEWESVKEHPVNTWKILKAIPGFEKLSEVAGSHHEKLDGSGYFRGLTGEHLSLECRILAVADVFDALSAKRPYRDSLPPETVFGILRKDAPRLLDATCVEALAQSGAESNQTLIDLQSLNDRLSSRPEQSFT